MEQLQSTLVISNDSLGRIFEQYETFQKEQRLYTG